MVQAEFTPTSEDYANANRQNLLCGWRRRRTLRAWVVMIASLAVIGGAIGWLDGGSDALALALFYALLGLVLIPLIHAISYALAPRRVRRLVRQQASATLPQAWSWDELGVTISHAQGSSRLPWAELFGWREGSFGFISYMNERSFFPLPRRALAAQQAGDLRAALTNAEMRLY